MKKKKAVKKEPLMYVGPTMPGVGISNTVYTSIPPGAAEAIEACPSIRTLFIRIRAYSKAERMLREERGYIYTAYKKALAYMKGGKK